MNLQCTICQTSISSNEYGCPECDLLYCEACQPSECSCGFIFPMLCDRCEEEIPSDASICPHCGLQSKKSAVIYPQWQTVTDIEGVGSTRISSTPYIAIPEEGNDVEESFSGTCPECATELYIEDGFCANCGQLICFYCGTAVEEEDPSCSSCKRALYWDCPNCQFELTAGTDLCPNCQTLFPNFCSNCHQPVIPGDKKCDSCDTPIQLHKRFAARLVHNLVSQNQLIQIVACPECGTQFNPESSQCPECDFRICSSCQLNLLPDEAICLRCGTAVHEAFPCPSCTHLLPQEADHCSNCDTNLCPDCQKIVSDSDTHCPHCQIEFELICAQCQQTIPASATECPHCGADF